MPVENLTTDRFDATVGGADIVFSCVSVGAIAEVLPGLVGAALH